MLRLCVRGRRVAQPTLETNPARTPSGHVPLVMEMHELQTKIVMEMAEMHA
jgi:hypothetical protein